MTASIGDAITAIEFASRVVHRIRSCTSIIDGTRKYIDEKLRKLNLPYDKSVLLSEHAKNWRQRSFELPLPGATLPNATLASQSVVPDASVAVATASTTGDARDDVWQRAFQESSERALSVFNVLFNIGIIEEVQNYKKELEKTFHPIVSSFRRLDMEPSLMLALLRRFSTSSHAVPSTYFETTRQQLEQATSLIEAQLKKEQLEEKRIDTQIAQTVSKTKTHKAHIEKSEILIAALNTQLEEARSRHSKWQKLLLRDSETLSSLQRQLHEVSTKTRQSSELHQKQLKIIQLYKSNYTTVLELIDVIKQCQAAQEGQQSMFSVDPGPTDSASLVDHSLLDSARLLPASPTYFSLLPEANPISNIQQAENYLNNDLHLDFDLFSDGFNANPSHSASVHGDLFQPSDAIINGRHEEEDLMLSDEPAFGIAEQGSGNASWDLSTMLQIHSSADQQIPDTFLAQVEDANNNNNNSGDNGGCEIKSSLAKRPKVNTPVTVGAVVVEDEGENEEGANILLEQQQQQQPSQEEQDQGLSTAESVAAQNTIPTKEHCLFENLFYRLQFRDASDVPLEKIVAVRDFWSTAPGFPKTVLQLLVLHHTTLQTEIINIRIHGKSVDQVADELRVIDQRLLQQPSVGVVYALYQLPSRGSLYTAYNLHQDALLWRIHWNAFDRPADSNSKELTLQDRFLAPNVHRRMLVAQKFEPDPLFLLTVQGIPRDQLPVFTQTHLATTKYANLYAIGFNARFGKDKKSGRHIRRARFNLTLFWRSEATQNSSVDKSVDISTVFYHLPRENSSSASGDLEKKDKPAYVCEMDKRAMGAPLAHFFTLMTREELHGHSLVQFVTLGTAFQNLVAASDDISEESRAHLEAILAKVEKRNQKSLFTLALNRTSQVQMNIVERFYPSADYKDHGMMYSDPVDIGLPSSSATMHISSYSISSNLFQDRLKKEAISDGASATRQRIEEQRAALVWFACQHDYTQWPSFTWDTAQNYVPGLQVRTSVGKTNIPAGCMADEQYAYLSHRLECQTYHVFSLIRSEWLEHQAPVNGNQTCACPYFLAYEPVVADFPSGSTAETVDLVCNSVRVPARSRTLCADMSRVYAEFNRVVDSQIKVRTSGKLVAIPSVNSAAAAATSTAPATPTPAQAEFVRFLLPFVRIHLINTQSPNSLVSVSGTIDKRDLSQCKASGEPARAWLDFLFPDFCLHELGWSGSSILELFEVVLQNACGDIAVSITLQDMAEFKHVDPSSNDRFRLSCFYAYANSFAANHVIGSEVDCNALIQQLFFYGRRNYVPVCLQSSAENSSNEHMDTLRPVLELFVQLLNTPARDTWFKVAPSAIKISDSDNMKLWDYLLEKIGARIIESQPYANAAEILFGLMTSDREFSDYCRYSLLRIPYIDSSVFLRLCWLLTTYSKKLPVDKKFYWEKLLPAW